MGWRWLWFAVVLILATVDAKKKFHKFARARLDEAPAPERYKYLSVCYDQTAERMKITEGKNCSDELGPQIAIGRYANEVNTTGWGVLEIETFNVSDYEHQAYAAGVAEGELTRLQIKYHYMNTIHNLCKGYREYCKRLYRYLGKNLDWLRSSVIQNSPTDKYWRHVNLTFAQLTGIYDAYMKRNLTPEIGFDITPILLMQYSGDLFDLNKFLNKTRDPLEYPEGGRCTGFVKLAPNNSDLFFAHVAMSSLSWMNRILKLYKFAYDPKDVPGYTVSFSGYPATLASADDYTLASSGLASIETTIAIFNQTLYTPQFLKTEDAIACWARSFISNALASTAKEWVDIFGKHNSGTYNNQWTVLDYKKFSPGKPLPDKDVLWVLEQTPGFVEKEDVTYVLKAYSYWPSYNIPFLKKINHISGFDKKAEKFDWYYWGYSPRARIIKRDHHKVVDLDSLTKLMRYNDYQHEEFARCNCTPDPWTAEGGMSARGDLNNPNGTYEVDSMSFRDHAGLDYKGTNYEMFKKLEFRAWGGPTYDPLPVFSWKTTKLANISHYGQPETWNFTYVDLAWESHVKVTGLH